MWLPLEVAIVHRRTAASGRQALLTRRAAAVLVGALELAVIIGALTSGALVEATSMTVLLMLPAIVVTAVLVVIWFGVEDAPGQATGGIDWAGLGLVTLVLGLMMGGLIAMRLTGPGSVLPWLLLLAAVASAYPFVRFELGRSEPIIDVRLMAAPAQWPVQLTAFLFGMSVLGAQIPLSTFARTDPDTVGYGLGADAAFVSTLIGVYVVALAIGAFTLPLTSRVLGARNALLVSCLLVAAGYALWLPLHDTTAQALTNMAVAGIGSGALVAALPAAAAAAAPPDRTGFATGHDQRHQDRRRRDRVLGLRHRAGVHGVARGARRRPCAAVGLPHRVGGLRGRGPVRGGRAARRTGARVQRRRRRGGPELAGHVNSAGMDEDEARETVRGVESRDRRTGASAAAARIRHQHTWVDLQVRKAMDRGDFDDLPGAGKPISDLGTQHDPDWWLKRLIERERITGVLPAALQLRKDDAELDELLDRLGTEAGVRREVDDFNARVVSARPSAGGRTAGDHPDPRRRRDRGRVARAPVAAYGSTCGGPRPTAPIGVAAVVATWNASYRTRVTSR